MINIIRFSKNMTREDIFSAVEEKLNVSESVSEIIENVRKNKDKALYEYCERFDRAKLDSLIVSEEEIDEAFASTDPELIRIMQDAAKNIYAFHENQKSSGFIIAEKDGVVLGQRVIPIEKVGLYIPGGTASYPSSVLMNAIPAKIAGVSSIAMVSPPTYKNGKIAPAILAAARIAGVDKIYKVGGAQAIAALAYGTESIEKVDKIVGPGNAYVAEAKRQVFGRVSIDMIAGPSEILVIADKTCNPAYVAADMLSQAEHDKLASAVLVTDSEDLAYKVQAELEVQIPKLSRSEIARYSIDNYGKIIIADSLYDVIDASNEIAPEHLEICTDDPFDILPRIKNAGSVFLGKYCPEPLGDYYSGTNHTLPTSGSARFSSPLSVDDFVKKSAYSYYTRDALKKVYSDVAAFANAEGLTAHARSITVRFDGEEK